jgi:hypothetical protein
VDAVRQSKNRQWPDRLGEPEFGRSLAGQSQRHAHYKERQAINKENGDDIPDKKGGNWVHR